MGRLTNEDCCKSGLIEEQPGGVVVEVYVDSGGVVAEVLSGQDQSYRSRSRTGYHLIELRQGWLQRGAS